MSAKNATKFHAKFYLSMVFKAILHTVRVLTLPRSAVQTVGQRGCVLLPVLEEVRIIKVILLFLSVRFKKRQVHY